jgi:hypothetical protein
MSESFSALFAVYFEALRLLDPAFRAGLEARRPGIPAEALRIPTLPEALETLDKSGHAYHRKHAALALSLLHWGTTKGRVNPKEMSAYQESLASFLQAHDVNLDGLGAANDASEAFLAPLAGSCAPTAFWIRTAFFSGTDVTTCAAGVEVSRAVDAFKPMLDPRAWQTTVPETFAHTYRTVEIPVVPESDPADADAGGPQPPLGDPWQGKLFEQANWPLGGLFVVARNLLRIDYQHLIANVNTSERLFLRYALDESLTSSTSALSIPVMEQLGGIDHDSGFVDVRTLQNGNTSLAAEKSLRFTKELAWLNALSPAYLFTWMSLAVLGGACYQFSLGAETNP